jgi:Ca-activated chloride channel family protein
MTIKLRYKQPEGTTSSLMTRTVSNRSAATENLGFAAAVVEFGMLLRQSEFKGSASYAEARDLARRFKGTDPYGHRAEFIRLVDVAESLQRLHPLGN